MLVRTAGTAMAAIGFTSPRTAESCGGAVRRWTSVTPRMPISAIGVLVEGLRQRRDAGLAPFTTICCDNLTNNGRKLGAAVIALAGRIYRRSLLHTGQRMKLGAALRGRD